MKLIDKIEQAGLVGRGGAGFPTHLKWRMVKKAKGDTKYVICNASEGEIGLFKDVHILKTHPEKVFEGMALAMDYVGTKTGWINFNKEYYKQTRRKVDKLVSFYKGEGYTIHIYKEDPAYPGGEETALLNNIEGKRLQPRMKPPYPSDVGLFGKPTLIHNVETLANVSDVHRGIFEDKRYVCISGMAKNKGVFHLPADYTIQKILKETGNVPKKDYFLQIGGSASGEVINKKQAEKKVMVGAGGLEIYDAEKTNPRDLLLKWFSFYNHQSCGKCTPCREGTYQLYRLVNDNKQVPWKKIMPILETLENTSFCALGKFVPVPVRSYLKNVLKKKV